ncbi:DnaJ-domain-containing protein [Hysterangium stoloniferum]|nr:DnaJ-domain-containing protein [Hysterangium stoloniferum]
MNTDEALKCLKLAQRYRDAGEYASARKFAQKSINLQSTPEAVKLLSVINQEAESSSRSSGSSSRTTGTETSASASSTRSRANAAPSSDSSAAPKKATYTEAQIKLVRRVRGCKVTDYYQILELEKTCEENDVKKAYRKLALQLHPDKNNAPGADEAFKMVSKAFQILSDSQKRAIYDQSGGDPDSRFGGGGGDGGPAGMGRHFAGGRQFEGEISPEDLFNMFFGGGLGGQMGGGFGGGGFGGAVFTTSFGPGFRTTRVHRGGAGARPAANAEPQSARSILLQLAPLLLLFFFSFISSMPSLFTTSQPPHPKYELSPNPPYTAARMTSTLDIPYYVSPQEFTAHPIWSSIPEVYRNQAKAGRSSRQLSNFEHSIEHRWKNEMIRSCEWQLGERTRKLEANSGIFGIGADRDALRRIREEKLESCEVLKAKRLISNY